MQFQENNTEPISARWLALNIWRHPFHVIWRIHDQASILTLSVIIVALIALSLIPAIVEVAFPASDYGHEHLRAMKIAALASSLELFLLVFGFLVSYIFFRIIALASVIPLAQKLSGMNAVLSMLKSPLRTLREVYAEQNYSPLIPALIAIGFLILFFATSFGSRYTTIISIQLMGALAILFFGTHFISIIFGGKATFMQTMKGLVLSVMPVVVGVACLNINHYIFKLLITPIYANISPLYYDAGSLRNLSIQESEFLIGTHVLIMLFFAPSFLFVLRHYHQLSWGRVMLVLIMLGVISAVYYGIALVLLAMMSVT